MIGVFVTFRYGDNFDEQVVRKIAETARVRFEGMRGLVFGLLNAELVVMVYTERSGGPHIISLRRSEKYEARYYFKVAKDYLG